LADENEDVTEFDHQIWKQEKERTRTVKNFESQQRCQAKKMRRTQRCKVRFVIERLRRERKREKTPAEKNGAIHRLNAKAEVKQARREQFSQS
jgi:hypothetical protein